MSSKTFSPFKDFQSDQMQRSCRKIFTTHFACMNAGSNLTPVTGTTNPGLTDSFSQIINSLIESFELKLTCLACKRWILHVLLFYLKIPTGTDRRTLQPVQQTSVVLTSHAYSTEPKYKYR